MIGTILGARKGGPGESAEAVLGNLSEVLGKAADFVSQRVQSLKTFDLDSVAGGKNTKLV